MTESELLKLVVRSLEAIELNPRYKVVFSGEYHKPINKNVCQVNLAGAVMAFHLKADNSVYLTPIDFDEEWSKRLFAVYELQFLEYWGVLSINTVGSNAGAPELEKIIWSTIYPELDPEQTWTNEEEDRYQAKVGRVMKYEEPEIFKQILRKLSQKLETLKMGYIPESPRKVSFKDCTYVPETRVLTSNGKEHKLSQTLGRLLEVLYSHHEKIIPRDLILQQLWQNQVRVESNLNVSIGRLRDAIGDNKESPWCIKTIRGEGYQFLPDVSFDDEALDEIRKAEVKNILVYSSNAKDSKTKNQIQTQKADFRRKAVFASLSVAALSFVGFLFIL